MRINITEYTQLKNIESFSNNLPTTIKNIFYKVYNSDLSVNEICKVFVKDLITLLNSTIPYQKLSKKQSKMKPWINKNLIFECRKKEKLYKNFKKKEY